MSLKQKQKEELGLNIFDPKNINLYIDDEEELTLEIKDKAKKHHQVNLNPAFPLSQVGRFISFEDEDGEEIGMLKDMNELDPESRKVLDKTLEKIYFMPKIIEVNSITEEFGVTRWDVETEKGSRSFEIKSRRRDVRPYGNGRIIIHDIDGNRYEITDHRQLDKDSQKVLRSEI